jgi:hypothetical protein
MKFTAAQLSLAVITALVATLLAITLSLARDGAVSVSYVILLAAVGFIGSLLYSYLRDRRR